MYAEFPVEKEKLGVWKSQANHVINYREEKFDFVAPADVAESMHGLVNWVNAEKEKIVAKKKDALHPVELSFEFHLRYLTIHPFYDGNGRTGRILTNLILISYGFPPIYVKDTNKQSYYRYLADVPGYGAEKQLFFDLMAGYLFRSLNIVLDAIAGKEIEEPIWRAAIDCLGSIVIRFLEKSYDIWVDDFFPSAERVQIVKKFERNLNRTLTQIEITEIAAMLGNTIFKQIDYFTHRKDILS